MGNIREAANKEGRIWAVEYDVSGVPDDRLLDLIKKDWAWLIDQFGLRKDPSYAHEKGKLVVFVWGMPLPDRQYLGGHRECRGRLSQKRSGLRWKLRHRRPPRPLARSRPEWRGTHQTIRRLCLRGCRVLTRMTFVSSARSASTITRTSGPDFPGRISSTSRPGRSRPTILAPGGKFYEDLLNKVTSRRSRPPLRRHVRRIQRGHRRDADE